MDLVIYLKLPLGLLKIKEDKSAAMLLLDKI